MPEIIIKATENSNGGESERDADVVIHREQVDPDQLTSETDGQRLIARIGWALTDAEMYEQQRAS